MLLYWKKQDDAGLRPQRVVWDVNIADDDARTESADFTFSESKAASLDTEFLENVLGADLADLDARTHEMLTRDPDMLGVSVETRDQIDKLAGKNKTTVLDELITPALRKVVEARLKTDKDFADKHKDTPWFSESAGKVVKGLNPKVEAVVRAEMADMATGRADEKLKETYTQERTVMAKAYIYSVDNIKDVHGEDLSKIQSTLDPVLNWTTFENTWEDDAASRALLALLQSSTYTDALSKLSTSAASSTDVDTARDAYKTAATDLANKTEERDGLAERVQILEKFFAEVENIRARLEQHALLEQEISDIDDDLNAGEAGSAMQLFKEAQANAAAHTTGKQANSYKKELREAKERLEQVRTKKSDKLKERSSLQSDIKITAKPFESLLGLTNPSFTDITKVFASGGAVDLITAEEVQSQLIDAKDELQDAELAVEEYTKTSERAQTKYESARSDSLEKPDLTESGKYKSAEKLLHALEVQRFVDRGADKKDAARMGDAMTRLHMQEAESVAHRDHVATQAEEAVKHRGWKKAWAEKILHPVDTIANNETAQKMWSGTKTGAKVAFAPYIGAKKAYSAIDNKLGGAITNTAATAGNIGWHLLTGKQWGEGGALKSFVRKPKQVANDNEAMAEAA